MTRVLANHEDLAMASDDFALVAHFLDRRTYLHFSIPFGYAFSSIYKRPAADVIAEIRRGKPAGSLLEAVRDTPAIQVVDGQLDRDLVARENLDVVHTHLPRNVGQDLVAVLELDLEHRVRQRFKDRALKLDDILFRQLCSPLNVDLRQQHEMISNI